MALIHDIRQLFQTHLRKPVPEVSLKKHIWSDGWTALAAPQDVANDLIKQFSPCYTDLSVLHLPGVYDSMTPEGRASIIALNGEAFDPTGPSGRQYFFLGLVLQGVRAKATPDQECLYDSEL